MNKSRKEKERDRLHTSSSYLTGRLWPVDAMIGWFSRATSREIEVVIHC